MPVLLWKNFQSTWTHLRGYSVFMSEGTSLTSTFPSPVISCQLSSDLNASKSPAKNRLNTTSAERPSCGTGPCSSRQINTRESHRAELQKNHRPWQIFTIMQHSYWPAYVPYLNIKSKIKKKSNYCHFIPKYFQQFLFMNIWIHFLSVIL